MSLRNDENVVISAGPCALTLLPRFGGKIASLRLKGRELLQQPLAPIAARSRSMAFDEADASGWDECLPSVSVCTVSYADKVVPIPDHGDLWRVEWTAHQATGGCGPTLDPSADSVRLRARCFSLPLELERTVQLLETSGAWRIALHYRLTNAGIAPAPWSWAAHPLFAVDPGDCINLPNGISTLQLEGSGTGRLGKKGDSVTWPIAKLAHCAGDTDLRFMPGPDSGVADKLFAGPLDGPVAWCELLRPAARVAIRVSFETAKTPYLGLWICDGGWPERPGPKQRCVAVEPSTAPVDSLGDSGPWTRMLEPGKSYEWNMLVDIRTI